MRFEFFFGIVETCTSSDVPDEIRKEVSPKKITTSNFEKVAEKKSQPVEFPRPTSRIQPALAEVDENAESRKSEKANDPRQTSEIANNGTEN